MEHPFHQHEPHAEHGALPQGPAADPAQESLAGALRFSFNILRILMIVLVVLYVASGIFQVDSGQKGLVARLGKLRPAPGGEGSFVFEPGWYFNMLPEPFDQKFIIPGQVQNLISTRFMFNHEEAATAKDLAKILRPTMNLTPGTDGAMLTGDKNLSHGRWEVQYTISDAADFVQNVGRTPADLEPLLLRLTETAVVREVAGRTVEEVTRGGLDSVRRGVQSRLQKALDELKTGVQIDQIVAYTIEPGGVRDAFIDVSRAEQEKLAAERQAQERATEILNRAAGDECDDLLAVIRRYSDAQLAGAEPTTLDELRAEIDQRLLAVRSGQVAVLLNDARAAANQVHRRWVAEFEEFRKRLEEREASPRIALLGLWAQMRAEVLDAAARDLEGGVSFMPKDARELEILIGPDARRRQELEAEQAIRQQFGAPQ